MTATEHIRNKTRQWAEQTGETYRCPAHQEPNPFCACVDATGKRVNGQVVYDGLWGERGDAVQTARRRYHAWADQQRPEVQSQKAKFKQMIEVKHDELKRFKEWRARWAAAGFKAIGHYAGKG